jgi:small subunit ribosomal protein S4
LARYRGSVCRLCRREGLKLFLKGERCYTEKCAIERRTYAPGQHGKGRRVKFSEYGLQLREKQKVKRIYGVLERQFRRYYKAAARRKGVTGIQLLLALEGRLDNAAYRFGFASSRSEARQLVRHGHFLVNGRKVNIPSYQTKPGDVIELREKSRNVARFQHNLELASRRGLPHWLEYDPKAFKGTIKALPAREDLTMPIQEQLIIELYSK